MYLYEQEVTLVCRQSFEDDDLVDAKSSTMIVLLRGNSVFKFYKLWKIEQIPAMEGKFNPYEILGVDANVMFFVTRAVAILK